MTTLKQIYEQRKDLQDLYDIDTGLAKNSKDPRVKDIPTIQDWWRKYGVKEYPDTDVGKIRDYEKEKEAINLFTQSKGTSPATASDWAKIAQMTYSSDEMPEEFKSLMKTPEQNISTVGLERDTAKEQALGLSKNAQETQRTTPMAFSVLQNALRTKQGVPAIGTSKIFEQAGLKGYGSLSQSLSARSNEINTNFANYSNFIKDLYSSQLASNQQLIDTADLALKKYEMVNDEYKQLTDRLNQLEDTKNTNEQTLKVLQQQFENNKQLEELKSKLTKEELGYKSGIEKGEIDPITGLPVPIEANAQQIADAIKQIESGGNYNAQGKAGESGAYQYLPETWRKISSDYQSANLGVSTRYALPYTSENQDKVTKWKIQDLLDKNFSPKEIALIWNTSLGGQEKPLIKKGEGYDSENYADKVVGVLKSYKSAGSKFTPEFYATDYGQKVLNNEQEYNFKFLSQELIKNYLEVQNKAISVEKIIDLGVGGPGDLALVFEFMKGLDPSSVVRESEYDSAAKSGNIFKGWAAKFNGYMKEEGGILPENVKQSFVKIVQTKLGVYQQQYDNLKDSFRKTAEEQGLNPDHVAPNMEIDFGIKKQEYPVGTIIEKSGKKYRVLDNNQYEEIIK